MKLGGNLSGDGDRLQTALDTDDAVFDVRMTEEVGGGLEADVVARDHDALEEAGHSLGAVAGSRHEVGADVIGLGLELAREPELEGHVEPLAGEQRSWLSGRHRGGHAGELGEEVRDRGLLPHPGVVAALHVADLVGDHPRQLVQRAGLEDRAAMQVDVASRHREGVERRIDDDAKVVDEGLGFDLADDGSTEFIDEFEHHRIIDEADVPLNLAVECRADLPLLLDGDLGVGVDRVEAGSVVLDAGERAQQDCQS